MTTREMEFPSPTGSSYFSMEREVLLILGDEEGFRPLRGLRISQCMD